MKDTLCKGRHSAGSNEGWHNRRVSRWLTQLEVEIEAAADVKAEAVIMRGSSRGETHQVEWQ